MAKYYEKHAPDISKLPVRQFIVTMSYLEIT